MVQVVPSNLHFPDTEPNGFVASLNDVVQFFNFGVGSSKPVKQHTDFITTCVAFLIRQVNANVFKDKTLTIHLFGMASATGSADKNKALSEARAAEIGAAFVKEFDIQKKASPAASGMTMQPIASGGGDVIAKEQLAALKAANPKVQLNSSDIEKLQTGDRCVFTRLNAQHVVVDDDKTVECRQLLTAVVKVEHKPANLLEQTIDEIQTSLKSAFNGHGVVKFFVDQIVDQVLTPIKDMIKTTFKELTADFPEIAALLFAFDFIIPSDIQNVFEFRDSRGKTAQYAYTGSQNKIGFGVLDALCKVLSLLKWVTSTIEAFQRFADQMKRQGKNVEAILDVLSKLKKVQGALKSIFDQLTKKDSLLRNVIGDEACDLIVKVINEDLRGKIALDTTDFAPVRFESDTVLDITTFKGPARTEVREFLLEAKIFLDFLGAGPEGRLGFGGHSLMLSKFALNNNLLGFGISKGALVNTKVSAAA